MGTVIDSLYSPIVLNDAKNIDTRYFRDNGDGTFTPTPLLIYNIARDAESYFKQRIFELDDSKSFHTESLREVKDTWAEKTHNDQWNFKYGELIKEATKRWHEYRNSHPDEFEVRFKRIDIGGIDEARFFAGYSPDVKLGLTDTIKSYNAARELLARFAAPNKDGEAGPEYSSLPFEEPLYSKEEFVEAHKALRAKISQELGIPDDDFVVTKIEKLVPRINNKKCVAVGADDTNMKPFIDGLITHITSSNAQEFKAKREEVLTLINQDFVMAFNESAKYLKAVEEKADMYAIYSKLTDDSSSIKLITISKNEATDVNYKFYLSVDAEDGTSITYSKIIATKADLRKAMEIAFDMLNNDNSLQKYSRDIENALEKL